MGGASLALGRVTALAGPGPPARAEAGLLCHPAAVGGAPGPAPSYALPGSPRATGTPRPHVPPVALPGRASLLLLHVQTDVASELDGLIEEFEKEKRNKLALHVQLPVT